MEQNWVDVPCIKGYQSSFFSSMKTECNYLNGWIKKNGHIRKNLARNGEPQRYSWGTQKKKMSRFLLSLFMRSLFSWLAIIHGKNFNIGHWTHTSPQINQILLYRPCLETPLTSTILDQFQWPWLWLRPQDQMEVKSVEFVLNTSKVIRIKCNIVLKKFKLNILISLPREDCLIQGNS